jgi:2-polyprenyl-3-methyl-5-hydroxy-6-metoxy-1,4-benzoquinol methylase
VDDAFEFSEPVRYDVVVASEVFEHILEPERLADVIRRHTVEGGILVFTTPNGYGPWEMKNTLNPYGAVRRWNWLRRLTGREPYAAGGGRDHCQRYTKGGLVALFAAQSFRLIEFTKSDFVFTIFRPLRRSRFFGGLDTRLADTLPYWMASGWYMVFESENDS